MFGIDKFVSLLTEDNFQFKILMTDKQNNQFAVASIVKKPNTTKSYVVTVDQFD
jgi:phosphatidylethanolamine-binding protein (PEBP) family uncharacterized protein